MKPYGQEKLPAHIYTECFDVGDIRELGCKSSVGRFPGKGGDYRGYYRSAERKAASHRWVPSRERLEYKKARYRRHWKRKARAEGKAACKNFEEND